MNAPVDQPARPAATPINHALLPPVLRELVRVLGESAAFKLAQERGGTRLIVATRPNPRDPLLELLGPQAYGALIDAYGVTVIEMPKYDSVLRQLRHERVRQHRALGHTIDRVAAFTGYTRRHVINILQLAPEEKHQAGLFDAADAADEAA